MRKYDWNKLVTTEKIQLKIAIEFNKTHQGYNTAAALWKRYLKKKLPDGRLFRAYEGSAHGGSATGRNVFYCYIIFPKDDSEIGEVKFHPNPLEVFLHLSTIEAIFD